MADNQSSVREEAANAGKIWVILGVVLAVGWMLRSCQSGNTQQAPAPGPAVQASAAAPGILPEVDAFIRDQPTYGSSHGSVTSVEPEPDWARGARQWVHFNDGASLLYYTEAGQVVSVYQEKNGGPEREKIWDRQ